MPNYAEVVSTIALVVGASGLGLSVYVALRDRPRLKVSAKYFDENPDYGPARIAVTFINQGRRPVILRLLGGTDSAGKSSGTYLEHDKGGLRLGEHERHDCKLEKEDTVAMLPGDDLFFERLWVEDSLGNRHDIPNSREFIKRMWA